MTRQRSFLCSSVTVLTVLALLFQPFNALAMSDPGRASGPIPSRSRQPEPQDVRYSITTENWNRRAAC
jgi:hypothetical protein